MSPMKRLRPPQAATIGPSAVGEAGRIVQETGAALVDVRAPEAFAEGHAPGAVNIPTEDLPMRLGELSSDIVVVYGDQGEAAAVLRRSGYVAFDAGRELE
jgi:phage shock protein E